LRDFPRDIAPARNEYDNVKGQAYDRGYEVGLYEQRQAKRLAEQELERLNRQWEWAADGNVGLD
jgi:hypothetical protein